MTIKSTVYCIVIGFGFKWYHSKVVCSVLFDLLIHYFIMNKSQKDNFIRELDSNISKIIDSYRLLLKKGQVNLYETNNSSQHGLKESSCSVHDDLLLDVASFNIVSSLYRYYYNYSWSTLIWL